MRVKKDESVQENRPATEAQAAAMKKKKGLVAVLLVGLLIALLTQPDREEDTGSAVDIESVSYAANAVAIASPLSSPAHTLPPPLQQVSSQASLDQFALRRELSRIELSAMQQWELFAPEPRTEVKQKAAVETRRVQAVYGSARGGAALLGDSIVRDGEPLPGGVRVRRIHDRGIELVPTRDR